MKRLARRVLARVARTGWVRASVFPLLRRFPSLAMAVDRLVGLGRREAPEGDLVAPGDAQSAELGENARRVLADLRRVAARGGAFANAPRAGRLRVALVSPLPPQRTGIAAHAAELAQRLGERVDLETVSPESAASFAGRAEGFDAVIYQVGNSRAHRFVAELLEQCPGIVVLHDVYLKALLDELERSGARPHAFVRALYDSHGWPTLAFLGREGRDAAGWRYPASGALLARATRVIVHSQHARAEIHRWWGDALAQRCDVVPLLREPVAAVPRDEARGRLGIAPGEFVVCSFGMLGPTKCNQELLDGFLASTLAQDRACRLVFVGENVPNAYGAQIGRAVASHGAAASIAVTGFVEPADYALWLAATDMAVQLRRQSRGETSAAVLDCLVNGVATVVNDHGSAADLDASVALKLPDAFTTAELAHSIERLRGDAGLRARLAAAATAVREQHGASRVVAGYLASIEASARSPLAGYTRQLHTAAAALAGRPDADFAVAAGAIAAALPPAGLRQLFVDVSALARTDLGTGIQRVVREVLRQWFDAPPQGWRVEPVHSAGAGQPWRHARRFAAQLAGVPRLRMEETVIEPRAGDVFLALDLHIAVTVENEALLRRMRDDGVKVVFALYDLLPARMPSSFPPGMQADFTRWLATVANVADGVVAISRATAEDFAAWLDEHPPQRTRPLDIGCFALGADLPGDANEALPGSEARELESATARRALLMVGTIEPRKGHVQALLAMEQLWARGVDVNLVLVGKAGWMTDDLVERLRRHPQRNHRLFWFGQASDALLGRLYASCSALLAPSLGEGFGLPLAEAARQGLPIIARDLPVFREVAGEHAFYFEGMAAGDLAAAIERWLALHERGDHPRPEGVSPRSWQDSARSLEDVVLGGRWLRRWSAPS
ncbi:glycosyltransferase [Ramlibacter sp. PS4R-6]|uniref:glycosyltransferase n=1 Tax=Ramlibacter sp. PS4R-6 TaxID=3133438 RepID=UPI0030B3848E